MGELVSAQEFTLLYNMRHGVFPNSYYRQRSESIKNYVPVEEEMVHFLTTGNIPYIHPYKSFRYQVQEELRIEAFDRILDVARACNIRLVLPLISSERQTSRRVAVPGIYGDERGRATIIAGIDKPGQVKYITYTWRGVLAPPAGILPGPNVLYWRERTGRRA